MVSIGEYENRYLWENFPGPGSDGTRLVIRDKAFSEWISRPVHTDLGEFFSEEEIFGGFENGNFSSLEMEFVVWEFPWGWGFLWDLGVTESISNLG